MEWHLRFGRLCGGRYSLLAAHRCSRTGAPYRSCRKGGYGLPKITEKSDNLRKVDIFSIFQVLLWLLCFYQESVRTVLRGPEGFYTVTFNHRTIDYRNSRFNLRFALRVNFGTLRNSLHQFLLFDSLMFIPTFSLFRNFWPFPLLARFDLWDVAYMTSWGLVLEPFGCFHP